LNFNYFFRIILVSRFCS